MNKRFLITVVVLGSLAMLAVWILAAVFCITPQWKIAHDAGLESVADTILILQYFASFVVGCVCTHLCLKAIDAINEREG